MSRYLPFALVLGLAFALAALAGEEPACADTDPLASWNDGPAKQALLAFVESVTREGSPAFVPPSERIAVFDNDGTLWPENPLPFQLAFVFDELKRLAPQHPEWKDDAIVQAALTGDVATIHAGGHEALFHLIGLTHAGMTTAEFDQRVRDWIATARHPRFDRPYDQLAYQPMLEVLQYLRAHGFQTWIVSGGGVDFMRVWAERVYGIPPAQIVGSVGRTSFEMRDGKPVLVKQPEVDFVDDKAGKPVGIHRQIGRRPLAAFGNSDGDLQMLQWTTIGRAPGFGLIVHHTDAEREYAYDKAPKSSGKLVQGLVEAPQRGWIVVDVKRDWKRVFSGEPARAGVR